MTTTQTKHSAILWPDRKIGKRESRLIRDQYNALYEDYHKLLALAQRSITYPGAMCFEANTPGAYKRRLEAINVDARDIIHATTQHT